MSKLPDQGAEGLDSHDDSVGDRGRLKVLADSGLLDSEAEEIFDRGVRLATKLLGTKVALLSLVDENRQFFKAQQGLPLPYSERRETPLSHSFCQHVVQFGEVLAIADAREHPLVAENAAIQDLNVIAYLGVPIVAPDGHVLGSFCAIDGEPRQWSSDDVETLRAIAAGVESEVRLRIEAERRRRLQEKADADRARLALVLESTADGVLSIGRDLTVNYANRSAGGLLGEGLVGRHVRDVLPNAEGVAFNALVEDAFATGEAREAEIFCPSLGRWIEARAASQGGELSLFFRDVTARHRAQESRQLLTRELHHRIKNLFAIVRGMISMTARGATDPAEMARALQGRLISLSRAHDLIRPAMTDDDGANYQDIFLADLVTMLVEPYRKPGIENLAIEGPALRLGVNSTTHVALLVHELTTNASKYGALSEPGGRLSVGWTMDGETLDLAWVETGGPDPDGPPPRPGFGSQLIALCVETQLEGELMLNWLPTGLDLRAKIPLRAIAR